MKKRTYNRRSCLEGAGLPALSPALLAGAALGAAALWAVLFVAELAATLYYESRC